MAIPRPGGRSSEFQAELDALVNQRLDEGLSQVVIAQRLGVSVFVIQGVVRKRKTMAKDEKEKLTPMAIMARMIDKFEMCRGLINARFQSGMQTHHVQDAKLEIIRALDDCEADLKVLAKTE